MDKAASIPDHLLLPFTGHEDTRDPIIITGGEGAYLHTTDERKLFDGTSSLWVSNLGHRHPNITEAIKSQLGRIAHTSLHGQAHLPSIELAERLPGFAGLDGYHSFFCNSGSEAVETSLKVTLDYWQRIGEPSRTCILTMHNSYHGETAGAMSVNGGDEYKAYHQLQPYQTEIISSEAVTEQEKYLHSPVRTSLSNAVDKFGGYVAAIIIEPLHGAGGIVPVPTEELTAIQQVCDQVGCLLIVDEVATGFHRAGSRFHYQDYGLRPDMLLLGKGISAGYVPFAAVLIHPKIGEQYARSCHHDPLPHGHTFSGNPLACAAALSNIEVLSTKQMQEQIQTLHQALRDSLHAIFAGESRIHIRQRGLFAGIEVFSPDFIEEAPKIASEACRSLKQSSILAGSIGNTIMLAPPYVSTPEEIRNCVGKTHEALLATLAVHGY